MRIEAIFLGARDPKATSRFYAEALGLGEPETAHDGQYTFSGAGIFIAIGPADEPSTTIWFRTHHLAESLNRLIANGETVIAAPTAAGTESMATLLPRRSPPRLDCLITRRANGLS